MANSDSAPKRVRFDEHLISEAAAAAASTTTTSVATTLPTMSVGSGVGATTPISTATATAPSMALPRTMPNSVAAERATAVSTTTSMAGASVAAAAAAAMPSTAITTIGDINPESIFTSLGNIQYRRLQPGSPEFYNVIGPMNSTTGFFALAVFAVRNPDSDAHFNISSSSIARNNGGNANVITGYHCTSPTAIRSIMEDGFNISQSRVGFFGKGAYFATNVLKANNYSPQKGNPIATRLMLVCNVALGKTKQYGLGRFDRELAKAPEGFQSVRGFLNQDYEYVVYDKNQICPRYLVFYNFTNTALEIGPSRNIPPGIQGNVVFITAALSEFFGKLQQRATAEQQLAIKRLIANLLGQRIDVRQFLTETSALLRAAPPPDLESKLILELGRSNLSGNRQPTVISTSTSASTSASASGSGSGAAAIAPMRVATTTVPIATAMAPMSAAATGVRVGTFPSPTLTLGQSFQVLASAIRSNPQFAGQSISVDSGGRSFGTRLMSDMVHPILNGQFPITHGATNPNTNCSSTPTPMSVAAVAETITSTIIRTPSVEAAAALISIGHPQAQETITINDDEDFEHNDGSK